MRKLLAAAVLVLLAACGTSGGSAGPESAPTATAATPPMATIRQFASIAAAAQPHLEKQGSCTPLVDCAIEGAEAYVEMVAGFRALGEPPAEVGSLVGDVTGAQADVAALLGELSECEGDCTAEAITLQQALGDVSDGMAGWAPYY